MRREQGFRLWAHLGTADTVYRLLEDAGFRVAETHEDSFRIRFVDGSALLRHFLIRIGFMAGWKSVLPPKSLTETFQRLETNLNARAAAEGELALTIPMLCIEGTKGAPE